MRTAPSRTPSRTATVIRDSLIATGGRVGAGRRPSTPPRDSVPLPGAPRPTAADPCTRSAYAGREPVTVGSGTRWVRSGLAPDGAGDALLDREQRLHPRAVGPPVRAQHQAGLDQFQTGQH